MTQVRVLGYNVFMGGRRGAALHDVVRGTGADVLLVNESPKLRFGWRRRCRTLARGCGLEYAAGGRTAGSNMVATGPTVRVRWSTSRVFATRPFAPRRGVVSAQLRVDGRLFGVVCCHLSLDAERRTDEVDGVIAAADALRGPVILGGDLNERPTGPSWQRLRAAGFVDHGTSAWKTFPAASPSRRIDALLVRGAVTVLHHGDPGVPAELQEQASDHRGVLAVLDV